MSDQTLPVSVVICAYNAERYLERALRSIREQSYRNLDILVIDDASTDATASIAAELAARDDRIRIIAFETNAGIAHARQVGLESVRHDWLLFLDADDIALPTMIERQVAMLRTDPNIIGVSTYSYFFGDDEGKLIAEQRVGVPSKEAFLEKFANKQLIFLPIATLYSKAHALAVGGYRLDGFPAAEDVRYQDFCEDLDLWCRLGDFGAEEKYLISIPEPLFLCRKTSRSLSARNVFHMQEKMRWIKDCLKRRRSGLPEHLFCEYRKSLSKIRRLDHLRADCAAFLYKNAAFSYIHRRYLNAICLATAVSILSPGLVMQKMKTQKRTSR